MRDPLFTYPEPMSAELVRPPEYVAFVTRHSGQSLRNRYPACRAEYGGPITNQDDDRFWEMVVLFTHEPLFVLTSFLSTRLFPQYEYFQAALLLGYGYAHAVVGRLQPAHQAGLHVLLLVAA